ncbi:MAG TPA: glutathione S-transferase family protein [Caulobacterales bacterium]|nr:glutathione S-transferase family protein [Caulobacterales bacterium]
MVPRVTTLHIGNKNYSSWSLRPWLALRWGAIAFDETLLRLGEEGHGTQQNKAVLAVSPSGRVPCLHDGDLIVHDSLAICEWAAERAPALWPEDGDARALARAAAAEMHSGFADLRRALPMNIKRRMTRAPDWDDATRRDIARVISLWSELRTRFGGHQPYLFGARTIADAFFAPVAARFRTYAVTLPTAAQAYCETIFADDAFKEWERAAEEEVWGLPGADQVYA